jgi:hypothetical protein
MYDLEKKFIFTHPPKCGGTSIEELLGFLKLRETYPNVHRFKHGSLKMHVDKIKDCGFNANDFFKFSIIRNPWSRSVSFYNHVRHKEYDYYMNQASHLEIPQYVKDSIQMTFKQFVFTHYKNNFNSDVSTKPYMLLENNFSLNYVIRLEHLQEDFMSIQDNLQLKLNLDIPHLNNSDKYINRKNYKDYYDEETRNFIEDLFKYDIELFKYVY